MIDPPRRALASLVCWSSMVAIASPSMAEEPEGRPIVSGFERFFAAPGPEDASGGRLLIGELNCTSCHRGDDAPLAPVARKQAPILDRVGSRVKVEHLRAFLADPRKVKPGTTMPNLLAGLPKDEAEADVEALVHFLATTGSVTEKPRTASRSRRGRPSSSSPAARRATASRATSRRRWRPRSRSATSAASIRMPA